MSDQVTTFQSFLESWISPETTEEVMKRLIQFEGQVTSDILYDLITDHTLVRTQQEENYLRYKGDESGVPILTRELVNEDKVNNQVNNDFMGDVVDTKVGYMANEIVTGLKKESYRNAQGDLQEARFDEDLQLLRDFQAMNSTEDLNSELIKLSAICGLGGRLLYVDAEGQVRIMNPNPWECVWIYDRSIFQPQYAMRYYEVKIKEYNQGGASKERKVYRVEWYDQEYVQFFIQSGSDIFSPDTTEPGVDEQGRKLHMFSGIPLVAFPNNEEHIGDCQKVLELIDAYDRTVSDVNSEVEQLRLAYLILQDAGLEVDQDFVDLLRQTGVLPLSKEGRAAYLEKNLNDGIIEHHLDRIERNIMRFSKSVDFTSEAFGGNMPVIAFMIKISGLENKCQITENKFKRAFREQYRLLTDLWARAGRAAIDYLDLEFTFTRNVPQNLKEIAETLTLFRGQISLKTALSQVPFIDDPEKEIAEMEAEQEGEIELGELPEEEEEEPGAEEE